MEGSSSSSRVSDFSVDRILSPRLEACRPRELLHRQPLHREPLHRKPLHREPLHREPLHREPLHPEPLHGVRPEQVPVLPLALLACRGSCSYTQMFCPYSAGLHEFTGVYPNPNLRVQVCRQEASDAAQMSHYQHYQNQNQNQQQGRQKARMRTVFTESQSSQLEALFQRTDYPAAEARAELARSSGLSEETVRVWFKNRRARRKRQGGGSKVKSPQRSQTQIFNTVL